MVAHVVSMVGAGAARAARVRLRPSNSPEPPPAFLFCFFCVLRPGCGVFSFRYVYFQVSCVREGLRTPSIGVGLSTPEMPLSTLVGAFSNSIGLCSTGQVSRGPSVKSEDYCCVPGI